MLTLKFRNFLKLSRSLNGLVRIACDEVSLTSCQTKYFIRLYQTLHREEGPGTEMGTKNFFSFTDYDCIGFDLDNTLARYKVGAMIEMEYHILANYLVDNKGYSASHLLKPLDHNFIIKGLIVDDENGNLLRISADGTIIQATHGTKFLTEEEIKKYYPNLRWKATDLFAENPLQTWNGPYSEKMRTLLDYYDIIASLVFARAVDSIDEDSSEIKLYNIWPDLLEALQDMFTREHFQNEQGKYFAEIKANPDKYYYKCSNHLLNWIMALRSKGIITFLITGSYVDFATHTASHTIGQFWRDYFEIVISYAKKPGFFTDKNNFIGLDGFSETGPVNLDDLRLGGIYTHGNWTDLKDFLRKCCSKKDPKFLYIGDNLVQDIYAPHVYAGCETVTVCEELEAEGVYGHDKWHPDEQFLCSTIWGSYFKCSNSGRLTNWYEMMKKHSRFFVPSLEYVAGFPIDHKFKVNIY
ncbi:5'-nucleotidase domain-containing protein 1 [Sitophilus oryzae]|uniref:5'-nucleotidase domain-containing protein 1 n=1 Tax=Sitophilus oryzae TaxID=7048 RepID=A0A6J2XZB5_SITOR|nr:5'-nucleotidase domain-containing protein 1 [Sitophilus oryzae]